MVTKPSKTDDKGVAKGPKGGVTVVMATDDALAERAIPRAPDDPSSPVVSRTAIKRDLRLWSGPRETKKQPSIGSMQPDFKKR